MLIGVGATGWQAGGGVSAFCGGPLLANNALGAGAVSCVWYRDCAACAASGK